MPITIDCFKAYDVRGQIPNQLNADVCYRIGNATAEFLDGESIVVGRDMRLSSKEFADAVIQGLIDAGVEALDIGLCGTEMVYFATSFLECQRRHHGDRQPQPGGLQWPEVRPRGGATDQRRHRAWWTFGVWPRVTSASLPRNQGHVRQVDIFDDYIGHMLGYVDVARLKPLKLVVNAGNGCAGIAIDGLEKHLPFEFIKIHNEPDGTFPNGIPNPMLPENQAATADAVLAHKADMGIAWDGDFDRCFLFDENGRFIEGYYIVGLLAESLLEAPRRRQASCMTRA